jgi:hypothetical protein
VRSPFARALFFSCRCVPSICMPHPNTTAGLLSRTDYPGLGPRRSRLPGPPPRPRTLTRSPRRPGTPPASSQHHHGVMHGPARPTVIPRLRPSSSPGSTASEAPRSRYSRTVTRSGPHPDSDNAADPSWRHRCHATRNLPKPIVDCQSCILWQVAVLVPAQ